MNLSIKARHLRTAHLNTKQRTESSKTKYREKKGGLKCKNTAVIKENRNKKKDDKIQQDEEKLSVVSVRSKKSL